MIDIIIPVLNEVTILKEKEDYFKILRNKSNLIFVDGGSRDETVSIARRMGTVIQSSPGRGIQKNCGAAHAKTDKLFFMHVDTTINTEAISSIHAALNNGTACGCLTMQIDDDKWIFSIFSRIVNLRAKHLGIIDGDLGLFIRKNVFYQTGKFNHLPYMEDIVFSKKLRSFSRVTTLANPIIVSSRKWRENGFLKTFFRYLFAYVQLWTGSLKNVG